MFNLQCLDGKEARAVVQQAAESVDQVRRM